VVGCGEDVLLLCVHQSCHYSEPEHFRSHIVENTSEYYVHSVAELADYYPLPGYVIKITNSDGIGSFQTSSHGRQTLVTLKHYVSWKLHN